MKTSAPLRPDTFRLEESESGELRAAHGPSKATSKADTTGKVYGYARVSSRDQNLDRQIDAFLDFGINEKNIYSDKASGKDFNRPKYKTLMRKVRAGDVIVIKSIDRLGRNYEEILEEWRFITKKRRAAIVVLDMPLLDTRVIGGDLTGVFIADIMLQLLSYVAQTEREAIRARQAEGIAAAQARGVKFGRPKKAKPQSWPQVRRSYLNGRITKQQAATFLDISKTTFDKWMKE
ncbi:MAG: recombinase family protein [Eggerthellaceae bacterium]|nr:recombinase family protein [Eggerthellaceae bacterium]